MKGQVLLLEVFKLCLKDPDLFLPLYTEIFLDPLFRQELNKDFPNLEVVPTRFQGLPVAYFTPEVVKHIASKTVPKMEVLLSTGPYENTLPVWVVVYWQSGLRPEVVGETLLTVQKKGDIPAGQWLILKGLENGFHSHSTSLIYPISVECLISPFERIPLFQENGRILPL